MKRIGQPILEGYNNNFSTFLKTVDFNNINFENTDIISKNLVKISTEDEETRSILSNTDKMSNNTDILIDNNNYIQNLQHEYLEQLDKQNKKVDSIS